MIRMMGVSACLLMLCTATAALDLASSRGPGQGATVSFRESCPTELLIVPTGALVDRQWGIEAGFDRRYELSEFDQFFVAGAYRRGPISVAIGLAQMGDADLYREQIIRVLAAGHYGALSGGLIVSGKQVAVTGGYDQLRASSIGLGLSYRHRYVMVGTSLDNLNKPVLYKGAVPDNPVYSGYVEVIGHRSFSFTGRVSIEETKEVQLGLGQRIKLGSYSTFFWGLETRPVEYGAGVELRMGRHLFTYAASYHPTLGLSFTVTLATGGGGSQPTEERFD